MESRLRMIIIRAALPCPRVQWVVQDVDARNAVWLDLAWPEKLVGVEYEGAATPTRSRSSATPAATPGSSTAGGGSTATPSTTSTPSPTESSAS